MTERTAAPGIPTAGAPGLNGTYSATPIRSSTCAFPAGAPPPAESACRPFLDRRMGKGTMPAATRGSSPGGSPANESAPSLARSR